MPENEKNVTETPAPQDVDTPEDIAQQAAVTAGWLAHYEEAEKLAALNDQEERDKPDLRIAMVKLIHDLGQLIDDTAGELQRIRSKNEYDPFEVDEIRDVVAWQLAEFITLARYPRNDETYEYIVKGRQFTTDHAAFFFGVLEGYGNPPEFYVQGMPRKPAPESDEEGDQDEDTSDNQLSEVKPDAPEAPANIIDLPGYPSIEAVS